MTDPTIARVERFLAYQAAMRRAREYREAVDLATIQFAGGDMREFAMHVLELLDFRRQLTERQRRELDRLRRHGQPET